MDQVCAGGADRRAFLKRAAAAGALAWTAPIVLSAPAQAGGVTTPAGLPIVEQPLPTIVESTCSGRGSGNNPRTIVVEVSVPAPTVTCPLGGPAQITSIQATASPAGLTTFTINPDGSGIFRYEGSGRGVSSVSLERVLTVACGDNASTCTTNVSVPVVTTNNGNCNGFSTGPVSVGPTRCVAA